MEKSYDLTSLRLFVAVCEVKSITHAAEMEAIAASAVSKRIAKLEQLAGTRLLVRGRSGVVPTKTGATLLEHARNLIYNLDLIDRDLFQTAKKIRVTYESLPVHRQLRNSSPQRLHSSSPIPGTPASISNSRK
jgi:DNA-binding transcriptional LysR family regulator